MHPNCWGSLLKVVFLCCSSQKHLFILWFYVTLNAVQVISRRVVFLYAEETCIYSQSGLCTENYRPLVRIYQLSQKGQEFELPTSEVGGECVTTAPKWPLSQKQVIRLTCVIVTAVISITKPTISLRTNHMFFTGFPAHFHKYYCHSSCL